jgi:amidase
MALCRRFLRDNGVDKVIPEHGVDIIAFPMNSPSPRVAAAAGKKGHAELRFVRLTMPGYPIATVPVGTISHNGRPFGLALVAKAGREDLLFAFMSAFEANSPPRAVPPRS